MKDVKFLGVELNFFGDLTNSKMDFGSLTLTNEGREYKLDVCQTYRTFEGGFTSVRIDLEEDRETLNDCKYDLTAVDLMSSSIDANLFFESEDTPEDGTFFVKFINKDGSGCTKAIDLSNETVDWNANH